jgi:hypothetical protein
LAETPTPTQNSSTPRAPRSPSWRGTRRRGSGPRPTPNP